MALLGIRTGSQMQAIADANAKADIMKHGKKYGNLQRDSRFDKRNSTQKQRKKNQKIETLNILHNY